MTTKNRQQLLAELEALITLRNAFNKLMRLQGLTLEQVQVNEKAFTRVCEIDSLLARMPR